MQGRHAKHRFLSKYPHWQVKLYQVLHFQTQVTTHLDIPVDVTMLMQVIKSLESLLQDSSNHRLLKTIWKSCLHDVYT
jgi:hypothetical protein